VLLGGAAAFVLSKRKRTRLALLARTENVALAAGANEADAIAAMENPSLPPLSTPLTALFELVDQRPEESLAVIRAWIEEAEA
jgi:hypothetical protein